MTAIDPVTIEVEEFLSFLYDGLDGYVYSPVKDLSYKPTEEGHWTQNFFKWPEDHDKLVNYIQETSQTLDVYLAPVIFNEPSSRKEAIKYTKVLWCELDEKLPTGEELGEHKVAPPNLRVQTSSEQHQHWYWRLDDTLDSVSTIEVYTRSLTFCIPGADSSGWDANQVLRIPGTHNFKRNTPVRILESSHSVHPSSQFNSLPSPPDPLHEIDLGKVPDVTEVVLKYAWTEPAYKLYLTIQPPVEQRSTFLVRLAYYCAEMRMNDAEIFSILINADERWGKFKDRRDRVQRLTEIISRARIKYPEVQIQEQATSDSDIRIVGTLSLLNSKREIKWIIPGLLESKGSLLVTGPNGVGKTQFSLNMAIGLALGQSTLNFTIAEPSKILFVSLEMGWEQLKSFLSNITKNLPADTLSILEEQLLLLPLGESIALNNNETHQQALEKAIEQYKPNGLMMDSLGTAINGDLGNHSTVQPYLDWNDRIRNRHGVFTWVIHHHRKQGAKDIRKPTSVDDVYGDTYITGRASSVYCLWPTKDSSIIEAIPLKLRFSEKPANWFIKRHEDLTMDRTTKVSNTKSSGVKVSSPIQTAPTGNDRIVGI